MRKFLLALFLSITASPALAIPPWQLPAAGVSPQLPTALTDRFPADQCNTGSPFCSVHEDLGQILGGLSLEPTQSTFNGADSAVIVPSGGSSPKLETFSTIMQGLAGTGLTFGTQFQINFGTTAGTVAAGNDPRIVGALQATNNLSEVNPTLARGNLGLGSMSLLGSSAAGDLSGVWPNITVTGAGGSPLSTIAHSGSASDLVAGLVPVVRLPIFGSTTQGAVPASGGGTTNFLRADGGWTSSLPSGAGGTTNFLRADSTWVAALQASNNLSEVSPAPSRTHLGLGTLSVQNADNVTFSSGATSLMFGTNSTWSGTLVAPSGVSTPIDLEFNDQVTSDNGTAIVSGILVTSLFKGNQTQAVAAHAAVTGDMYIEGPSSPTTSFKQYIGGFFNAATLAGDGSLQTTVASACTPTTCGSGAVIPVTAVTSTNGVYTHTVNVGDLVGIIPVTLGFGRNKYWFGTATAVDPIAKTVTINPPIIGNVAAGATFWDLSQAANIWGIAVDAVNSVAGDTDANDPNENLWGLVGSEWDVGTRNSKPVWSRFGLLVVGLGNIPAIANDDAIAITGGSAGGSWQNGLMFTNVSSHNPVTAGGSLIAAEGNWQVTNFIDFSSVSCTGNEVFMPGFLIDCSGLVHTFGSQQSVNFFPVLTIGAGALGFNKGGHGETDIFNGNPSGSGGVAFYLVSNVGSPASSPFWSVDKTGAETVTNGVSILAGGLTSTGTASIKTNGGQFIVSGNAGTLRNFGIVQTAGANRWLEAGDSAAETGTGNTGTNRITCRYADDGLTLIDCPIQINRSTGLVSLFDGMSVSGNTSLTSIAFGLAPGLDVFEGYTFPLTYAAPAVRHLASAQYGPKNDSAQVFDYNPLISDFDALSGVATVPHGSTLLGTNAVAGYIENFSTNSGVGGTNAVAGYFQALCATTNSFCWNINGVIADSAFAGNDSASFIGSVTGTTLTTSGSITGTIRVGQTLSFAGAPANEQITVDNGDGTFTLNQSASASGLPMTTALAGQVIQHDEADVLVYHTTTFATGFALNGAFRVQPFASNGFVVNCNGCSGTTHWGTAFSSIAGAATNFAVIGDTAHTAAQVAGLNSQSVIWQYTDGGSATQRSASMLLLSEAAGGDLSITGTQPINLRINGAFEPGSWATAGRPTVPAGSMGYNTDLGRLDFFVGGSWRNFVRLDGDTLTGILNTNGTLGSSTNSQTFSTDRGVGFIIGDAGGTAANHLVLFPSQAGSPITLESQGSDTDVTILEAAQGAGAIQLGNLLHGVGFFVLDPGASITNGLVAKGGTASLPGFLFVSGGNLALSFSGSLAASATVGFTGLPTCVAAPSGVPADVTAAWAPECWNTATHSKDVYDPVSATWYHQTYTAGSG